MGTRGTDGKGLLIPREGLDLTSPSRFASPGCKAPRENLTAASLACTVKPWASLCPFELPRGRDPACALATGTESKGGWARAAWLGKVPVCSRPADFTRKVGVRTASSLFGVKGQVYFTAPLSVVPWLWVSTRTRELFCCRALWSRSRADSAAPLPSSLGPDTLPSAALQPQNA